MRVWFDTEFHEDGKTIDLISIGAVREDGKEYYAEVLGSDEIALRTPWLKANVWPHLLGPNAQKHRLEIAADLFSFCGEKPEIWAYYGNYDWIALCQLFGTMMSLPEGWPMFCLDVKQYAESVGNPRLPEQSTADHHALNDALWTKQAWEFLERFRFLTKGERMHVEASRQFLCDDVCLSKIGSQKLIGIIDKLENTLRLHAGDVLSANTQIDDLRRERDEWQEAAHKLAEVRA